MEQSISGARRLTATIVYINVYATLLCSCIVPLSSDKFTMGVRAIGGAKDIPLYGFSPTRSHHHHCLVEALDHSNFGLCAFKLLHG
jgi:hypothetical protein